MIYVPDKFQPKHPFRYPSDNEIEFERWYYENHHLGTEEREYLPIFWTAYYCRHRFGKDEKAMSELQRFLNRLDRSIKYYTIVQYDHGIQNDIDHLDVEVFSMSGGKTDYPLPLIAQAHAPAFKPQKDRFVNFIGNETHTIRKAILATYPRDRQHIITTQAHNLTSYCWNIARSVFTLCPRGFGPTSFRIQEALQYGSIPVYISDDFILPHNIPFESFGVLIDAKDANRIHEILSAIPAEEIKQKQKAIPHIYEKYFTYEGNQKVIQKTVAERRDTVGNLSV